MIIILEGPDGAGKSYLANKLKERGFQLAEKSTEGGYEGNKQKIIDMVDVIGHSEKIVFDRFPYISELVYGPLLRGESRNHYNDAYNIISDLSRSTKVIILFVSPDGSRKLDLETKEWKDQKMVDMVTAAAPIVIKNYNSLGECFRWGFSNNYSVDVLGFINDYEKERTEILVDYLCVE